MNNKRALRILFSLKWLVLVASLGFAANGSASIAPVNGKSTTTADHGKFKALQGPFDRAEDVTAACLTQNLISSTDKSAPTGALPHNTQLKDSVPKLKLSWLRCSSPVVARKISAACRLSHCQVPPRPIWPSRGPSLNR